MSFEFDDSRLKDLDHKRLKNNNLCMFLLVQYIRAKGSIYIPLKKKKMMDKDDLCIHNSIRIIRNDLIHAYEAPSFRERRRYVDHVGKAIRGCESQLACISRHSMIGDTCIPLPKIILTKSSQFIANFCVIMDLILYLKEINYICFSNMGEDFKIIWNKFNCFCEETKLPESIDKKKYPTWSYPWISDPVMKKHFDYLNDILKVGKISPKGYKSTSTHFFEAIRNYLVTSLKTKFAKKDNPMIYSKDSFLSKVNSKKNDLLVIYNLFRIYGKPLILFLSEMVKILPTFKEKLPHKEKILKKYEEIYMDDFCAVLPSVFAFIELHDFSKKITISDFLQQKILYLDFIRKFSRLRSWR